MRAQKDRAPTRTRQGRVINDGINGTRADTECADRTWWTRNALECVNEGARREEGDQAPRST